MKYYISTFGCYMNAHESEKLAGILQQMGYIAASSQEDADIIIFNTCAIRETAEQRAEGHIGITKKIKETRRAAKKKTIIAVGGCITQKAEKAQDIAKRFPYVDIIFGTHNLTQFDKLVQEYQTTKKQVISIIEETDVSTKSPTVRESRINAFVNIIYGCNNFCTYCIVPYVRGREKSRSIEDIVSEVKGLVAQSYKTITLLGQNVNSYGKDLYGENCFAKLLTEINKIEGEFWIKFMSSHPKDFSKSNIDAIAKLDKVCKTIHLPMQSGSTKVLTEMNRKYSAADYTRLVGEIRSTMPDITLTTDIIVGFPDESEQDFKDTLQMVRDIRFDSAFTYIYNKRSGTKAAVMPNQIPTKVKKERVSKLIELVNSISADKVNTLIGSTHKVLVEELASSKKSGKDKLVGTTFTNRVVTFEGSADLIGSFVDVKIVKVSAKKLIGEIVKKS